MRPDRPLDFNRPDPQAYLSGVRGKARRARVQEILRRVKEGGDSVAEDGPTDPAVRWARIVRDLGYTGSDLPTLAHEAGLPEELLERVYKAEPELPHPRALARVYSFLGGGYRPRPLLRVAHRYGWRPGMKARYPMSRTAPLDQRLLAAVDVAALDPGGDELLALCEDAQELQEVETP